MGDNILVAPVLAEGKVSRDIYLPRGEWVDPNGESHTGPIWLKDYPADLSVLPYFIKNGSVIPRLSLSLLAIAFVTTIWLAKRI